MSCGYLGKSSVWMRNGLSGVLWLEQGTRLNSEPNNTREDGVLKREKKMVLGLAFNFAILRSSPVPTDQRRLAAAMGFNPNVPRKE